MTLLPSGLVGINTVPTGYFLEVGGTVRGVTLRSEGSIYAEGGSINANTSLSAEPILLQRATLLQATTLLQPQVI